MTMTSFPPGLILVFGGLLLPLLPTRLRPLVLLGLPPVVLATVWMLPDGGASVPYLGWEIVPVEADALSRLFATIFGLMAWVGTLYALNQKKLLELVAAFAYAGSAIGVAMAGDLLTVFIFWEIMAIASGLILWSAGTPKSYRASMRYVSIHFLGGVVLLFGILAHANHTGSITFTAMTVDHWGTWLILAGFLINAAAPPFSAWLPDAYPEASWSGAVFLSAFTTKTAIYVLMRGFPGTEILIFLGLFMAFYGIIYALLENDVRRILAYGIISQVGIMITGIGIGTEMALNGTAALAFIHIIYKGILLMSAGSVLMMTGKRKCTELGGLFRTMPVTAICGVIGCLSISLPLTAGFVTKSMITQAAADEHMAIAWFLLTAASMGAFAYTGIKFSWFVFFQKDSGLRPAEPPLNMRAAMIIFAALCIAIGILPGPLYALLPYPVDYVPYTFAHVVNMLQLLFFAGLAFFILLPMMRPTETRNLDFDWFYRDGLRMLAKGGKAVLIVVQDAFNAICRLLMRGPVGYVMGFVKPEGMFARTTTAGAQAFWVVVALGVAAIGLYAAA
jgi:multicomponent Na+:H+ antiporter subunit D